MEQTIHKKKDNILKRWYTLCEPDKKVWFFQIFFYILYAILYALMTIFAAKTINCLYNQDWNGAFFWLAIELLDIILRNVFYHIEYIFYGKQLIHIRKTISTKIYRKILSVESKTLKKFSAEKIINIAQSNMGSASEFPDIIASIIQYMVQVIIAITAIFTTNIYAGIVVALLGVVNFFVINALNKRMGRILNSRYEKKDNSFKEYSKIISGKSVIEEMHGGAIYETNLLQHVNDFSKEYARYYRTYSFRGNIYYAIWNVVIYAITAFLIFMVSKGQLDVALYLIIVPYLSSCTDKLNTLYTKFDGTENMRVDVDRINLILNLTDKQMVQYGNINKEAEGYSLAFINVFYKAEEPEAVNLKDVNMLFTMKGVNIVKGKRSCGKRAIFNMLRRRIQPNSGKILLDNLNLYDYNEKTFKNHIDYCSAHPSFVNGTVKENLLMAHSNFHNIQKLVKVLNLTNVIQSLPQGYETLIGDIKNGETLFWIGLIRAALSKCKILMIYEYPEDVSEDFHIKLQNIIASSDPYKRTIILFTHKNNYDNLADTIYKIDNGKVKLVKALSETSKI